MQLIVRLTLKPANQILFGKIQKYDYLCLLSKGNFHG